MNTGAELAHPGEHLAAKLDTLNMSATELARWISVPTNRITGILNGQRAITADTALRLAHFFGTRAERWLNLQMTFDLQLATAKKGEAIAELATLKRVRRRRPISAASEARGARPPGRDVSAGEERRLL
jgi:addiction module HigA family antidote